jgi:hypothetical protein
MPEQSEGKLVLRFKYPDGRLSALITVDNDWKIEVFASEVAARAFAAEHNLEVEEIEDGNQAA